MSNLGSLGDAPPGGNLGLLASLLAKPTITGIWYNKKKIKLDGYHFIECRFDGCELHLEGTNFIIERCIIDSKTVIYFGGDTTKPIRLFNARYDWMYSSAPLFTPERDEDGRITIK